MFFLFPLASLELSKQFKEGELAHGILEVLMFNFTVVELSEKLLSLQPSKIQA